MRRRCLTLCILLALLAPAALAAQARVAPEPRDTAAVPAAAFILPAAMLGTGAGAIGWIAGSQTGWGGGDDPGLTGALVFGAVGATLGNMVAIRLVSRGRVPTAYAFAPALLGVVGGIAGAMVAGRSERADGWLIATGFAIGDGLFTALMAAPNQRR